MKITLIAYGIARDILQEHRKEFTVASPHTVGQVKAAICSQYPQFGELASLRFAVNEDYQDDTYLLKEYDEVVIIPPVSGG